MDAVNTISENLDKFLLWHFLGPVQVATYTLAVAPVKQFSALVGKLRDLMFPKIAEKNISYLKNNIYGKMMKLFILVIFITGTYIFLAPYLFSVVFPKYPESILYSQLFAITFVFYPQIFLTTTFSAHAKIKERYKISLVTSIGRIILLLIFVPLFGIMVVIISYITIKAISFMVSLFLFRRLSDGD